MPRYFNISGMVTHASNVMHNVLVTRYVLHVMESTHVLTQTYHSNTGDLCTFTTTVLPQKYFITWCNISLHIVNSITKFTYPTLDSYASAVYTAIIILTAH